MVILKKKVLRRLRAYLSKKRWTNQYSWQVKKDRTKPKLNVDSMDCQDLQVVASESPLEECISPQESQHPKS